MSPDPAEEPATPSYDFEDAGDQVIVTLYASGNVEIKNTEITSDSDCVEIVTQNGQKWKFPLYAHIYSDQVEVNAEPDTFLNRTAIELRLKKQKAHAPWPQLCSRSSASTMQQDKNENIDLVDEDPVSLSVKKIPHTFTQTIDDRVIVRLQVKQVHSHAVRFTATNFTATFKTDDEDFLRTQTIRAGTPIEVFVRVNDRIIAEDCSYTVTAECFEIVLIKDSERNVAWNQLESNTHSVSQPTTHLTTVAVHPLGETKISPIKNILTKPTIPLQPISINRYSDYQPITSGSFYRKDYTYSFSTSSTIGFTGIYNPANSCFMNAAVQCLANTCELRDYFQRSYHLMEINRTNPLGMKGIMAEEFATVMKNLWSGAYNYVDANQLREYVGKRHQEFAGNGQHDAQELLTILLDALHEDLNRVINKPLVPPVEDGNRPDQAIADECWLGYLARNDSVIVQLFTGQFKSKTKCPQCQKESTTFDPFTSLSVPLPKRISIDTIVTFRDEEVAPMKYRIVMSADGSIEELKRFVSAKCGLPAAKMMAYRIQDSSTVEHLTDESRVTNNSNSWSSAETTYITEVLTADENNGEPVTHFTFFQRIFKTLDYVSPCAYCQALPNPLQPPKFCKKCYQTSYCDDQCLRFHKSEHEHKCKFRSSIGHEMIGVPFIISVPESKLTCEYVFEQISNYAKRYADIRIEPTRRIKTSFEDHRYFDDYEGVADNGDDEDNFSDIENVDWPTIKNTLSSADSWSICRIGDYFVKTNRNKRRHHQGKDRKEKVPKHQTKTANNEDDHESVTMSEDSSSESSTGDFDMLDDIFGNQPLFRLTPITSDTPHDNARSIIEPGDDAENILRSYTTFAIDWFTDNKIDAPLRITAPLSYNRINGLIEDVSVLQSSIGDQDITLQQCLESFIKPEVLGPDDKWYCPHCKEHIQAEKRMSVWRLPPILIIHLKRFKYNQYSSYYMSSSREKIDTPVKFPIHDLNMAPYCTSSTDDDPTSPQARYDLYGVVNHRGSAWFGHYTSYARLLANNDSAKTEINWREFDDTRVSSLTNTKDLTRSDAYVLFYRNRHLPVNFTFPEPLEVDSPESTMV